MHQTQSYLRLVMVAGLFGAVGLSACVVTTSTDDNGGASGGAGASSIAGATTGAAGAATGGAATDGGATAAGGASSGGSGATAGSGGTAADPATAPACDKPMDSVGTPAATCQPEAQNVDACSTCIAKNCCMEYSQCYGTSPGNVCGYGGPQSKGEFACYQTCLQAVFNKSGGVITAEDRGTCANSCGTEKALNGALDCGPSVSFTTNALIACVADVPNGTCNTACYGG